MEKKENEILWKKCTAFHGHACGGLTIGYKAALLAIELLELTPGDGLHDCCISADEEIVCITETDACGVDAIQVLLGCSVGKGNLLFHIRGKQAFSFYNRKNGKSIRLVLKKRPEGMTKKESFAYYQSLSPAEMFDIKETTLSLPETARIFDSYACSCCGEMTGAHWIRLENGKLVCLDCYSDYKRFI